MVDTIKFSQMTSGGDLSNGEKTPGLFAGANVLFNNPWTFLPPGTTADRPTPSDSINYRLRFNTTEQLYEYYDAVLGAWTQLQESAFTQGPFVIYTADSSIPDGQNLGALADGLLKQSISAGIATLDIAVNSIDYWAPGDALTRTQAPTIGDDVTNKTYVDVEILGTVSSVSGTTDRITSTGGRNPIIDISASYVGQSSITTLGTIGTGIWQGTVIAPTYGGLGTGTPPSAGQIPIGNNGGTYTPAAINSGTNITVANGSASITVNLSGIISPTLGGTGVNNGSNTLTLAGTLATVGAFASSFTMTGATAVTFPTSGTLATTAGTVSSVSGTANRITSTGGTTPVIDISASYVGQSSITTLGTIGTGVWQGTLVGAIYGGTGVNNGSNTLTLAGTLATIGAFASTFTMTGATNVTFPTSGTLLTSAGAVTSITGTSNQVIASAATGAVTLSLPQSIGTSSNVGFGNVDSGASGRAGQFKVFPPLASQGYIAILANNNSAGDFHTNIFTAASVGQNQSLTIPDAGGAAANFLLTASASSVTLNYQLTMPSIAFSSTSGIIGTTTNDSAASGSVGEEMEQTSSPTALTTGAQTSIASRTLTAGDWDVWGSVEFSGNVSTNVTNLVAGISTTDNVLPAVPLYTSSAYGATGLVPFAGGIDIAFPTPSYRITVANATTTTIYMVTYGLFSVSTLSAKGAIYARRRR